MKPVELLKRDDFIPDACEVINKKRNLHHLFDKKDCTALWAAYKAGRPLILRGSPGTGKSQIAKAIAEQLGWAFVSEVIHGATELSDLFWQFDAVARLSEAQVQNTEYNEQQRQERQERLDSNKYLSPGRIWWAFDWKQAAAFHRQCKSSRQSPPETPDPNTNGHGWSPEEGGVVLLLDEMDKADPDLANGLLESMGNLEFSVPYLKSNGESTSNTIKADPSKLLVIITTNEERELPSAFVRRCFVHTLSMEDSDDTVKHPTYGDIELRYQWLIERGQLHFQGKIHPQAYLDVATELWKDRHKIHRYKPGLAEYIDLLRVLSSVEKDEQVKVISEIKDFALKKEMAT